MKVQKEVRFQPVVIVLETRDEVVHLLEMAETCKESLSKDNFSQFSASLANRIRDAMGEMQVPRKKVEER